MLKPSPPAGRNPATLRSFNGEPGLGLVGQKQRAVMHRASAHAAPRGQSSSRPPGNQALASGACSLPGSAHLCVPSPALCLQGVYCHLISHYMLMYPRPLSLGCSCSRAVGLILPLGELMACPDWHPSEADGHPSVPRPHRE